VLRERRVAHAKSGGVVARPMKIQEKRFLGKGA